MIWKNKARSLHETCKLIFFPLSLPRLLPDLTVYMSNTVGVLLEAGTAYPSRAPEFTTGFLVGSVLLIFLVLCVVLLCIFRFWVRCSGVRYDFHIKTMFGSSLPPVLCSCACLIHVICFYLRIVVSNTYCVVFLLCFSSSCVPNIASFSGLSFSDCPFGIFWRLFDNLHSF